ncbi:MAG: C10 family peptidase [Bacteroidota bacterium]|nr:C10 family peptidase [Bacteroidota bacterium]
MKKVSITTFLIFLSLIFVFNFQSCKQESLKETYVATIVSNYNYQKDTLFAPLNVAVEIASNINKSNVVSKIVGKTNMKSLKHRGKKTVKNYYTITDKEKKNPYFYVVNYDGGGYSIISADKRLMPILAYGDNGYFNVDSLPFGVAKWLEASASLIQYSRTTGLKQSSTVAYQWSSMSCDQDLVSYHSPSGGSLKSTQFYECPPPPPPANSETTVTVGPLLNTTWYQDCNYNSYCPNLSGGPCGHAYTGCSTTALAQVMAYWKYPTTYNGNTINWNSMSLTTGNDEVSKLMGYIFPLVISSYDAGGSSCTNDYNIRDALVDNFHYSSAALAGWVNLIKYNGGYDYDKVRSSIANLQPVILGGFSSDWSILGIPIVDDGHTWVCDGYMQTTYYTNGIESSQYLLFHMNWGWGGSYDNWYYFNDWNNPNGDFKYYNDMIYNIHP